MSEFSEVRDQEDDRDPYSTLGWTSQIAPFGMFVDERPMVELIPGFFSKARSKRLAKEIESSSIPVKQFDDGKNLLTQRHVYPSDLAEGGKLYDDLAKIIEATNNDLWQFALSGWFESFVYLTYEGGGYIKPHMDCTATDRTKIGFTLSLSQGGKDYEGGEFIANHDHENPYTLGLGDLIIFPGFMTHEVLPLTKGTRRGLTGWVGGPWWH